ncbi:MAG: O-antigen ligase family protein [Elusimicrobiales bacterium]|nr:O-antigen ligase family protein [Elusimicrobiales bacterium]
MKIITLMFLIIGFISGGLLDLKISFFLLFLMFVFVYFKNVRINSYYIFLYILSLIASLIFSNFSQSIDWFYIELLAVLFMISLSEKNDSYMIFFKKTIYVIGLFVFIDMIIGKLFNISFLFTSRNPNYQAFFYVLSIGFLLTDRRFNITYMILFILMWLGCFICASRNGVLAIILISTFEFFRFRFKVSKLVLIIFFLTLVLIVINFNNILKLDDPKAYKRFDFYIISIKAFLNNPFFGWGLGSFENVFEIFKFPYYDGLCYYNHSALHSHSHFLNILVEGGILMVIPMIFIIFLSLRGLFFYPILGISVFFMFDSILYLPFIRIIFFIVIAISFFIKNPNDFNFEIRKIAPVFFMIFLYFPFKDKKYLSHKLYYEAYRDIISSENVFKNAAISEYAYYYSPYNGLLSYFNGIFYRNFKSDRQEYWFKNAIELEPNFRNAKLELCFFYIETKRYNEAKDLFSQIDPNLKCTGNNFYSKIICNFDFDKYFYLKKIFYNY